MWAYRAVSSRCRFLSCAVRFFSVTVRIPADMPDLQSAEPSFHWCTAAGRPGPAPAPRHRYGFSEFCRCLPCKPAPLIRVGKDPLPFDGRLQIQSLSERPHSRTAGPLPDRDAGSSAAVIPVHHAGAAAHLMISRKRICENHTPFPARFPGIRVRIQPVLRYSVRPPGLIIRFSGPDNRVQVQLRIPVPANRRRAVKSPSRTG